MSRLATLKRKVRSMYYYIMDGGQEALISEKDRVVQIREGEGLTHIFAFRPDMNYVGQTLFLDDGGVVIIHNVGRTDMTEETAAHKFAKTELHELVHWAVEETGQQPGKYDILHCLEWNLTIEQELRYIEE